MCEENTRDMVLANAKVLSNMPPEERRAAELLQQILGGQYKPRDVDGAQGMHDFDLCLDDSRTIAVEVTTDTSAVDRAFRNQLDQIKLDDLPAMSKLKRIWYVDLVTPGVHADDQPASKSRVKELKAELPGLLLRLEQLGHTKLTIFCATTRDDTELQEQCKRLGVQSCFSCEASDEDPPRVCFGHGTYGGATGPCMISAAVNEKMPKKAEKLVKAKTTGASEAHLFVWLTIGDQHKGGRSEAMSFLQHTGLEGLPSIDLKGIDAVWVAVDAGPAHAPDCRHTWPILCFDKDGWHDWQLRRSP